MFISHILPRERIFHQTYRWDSTFIKVNNLKNNSIEIEELTEKPINNQRAVDILKQLDSFVKITNESYNNECRINLKCLNSSDENTIRSYNHLDKASQVINRIVQRVVHGYENAYLKRTGILKRIQDAVYLLFGWETERDKIHKLSINIYRTLHDASEGLVPMNLANLRRQSKYLDSFL